jgi:hypothetical protein
MPPRAGARCQDLFRPMPRWRAIPPGPKVADRSSDHPPSALLSPSDASDAFAFLLSSEKGS